MKTLYLLMILCFCFTFSIFGQDKILEIEGRVLIGDSANDTPQPGTIRWTGSDFEGWNGQLWVSLTGNARVGTVTDIDGNVYETIRIGNLEWMNENLKVTKYNDSTMIDQVTISGIWKTLTFGPWCWYENVSAMEDTYGKLYNWFAVNTGKLCPTGWHIPSETEWIDMTNYLGGPLVAGGKLKLPGTAQWWDPNSKATNESGFKGLPGGLRRGQTGVFVDEGKLGYWWSSTETGTQSAVNFYLIHYNDDGMTSNDIKTYGYSVRCVKDL